MIDLYDNTTTSDKHVDVDAIQMSLYTIDDIMLRRAFPTFLKEVVLSWFT